MLLRKSARRGYGERGKRKEIEMRYTYSAVMWFKSREDYEAKRLPIRAQSIRNDPTNGSSLRFRVPTDSMWLDRFVDWIPGATDSRWWTTGKTRIGDNSKELLELDDVFSKLTENDADTGVSWT